MSLPDTGTILSNQQPSNEQLVKQPQLQKMNQTSQQNVSTTVHLNSSRRLADGLSQIYNRFNLMNGFDDFLKAYSQLQIDSPEHNQGLHGNKIIQENREENENLNETPFFGSENPSFQKDSVQNQSKIKQTEKQAQEKSPSIFDRVTSKNSQAFEQFSTNFNVLDVKNTVKVVPQIFEKVQLKMEEAFTQFWTNYDQIRFQNNQQISKIPDKIPNEIDEDNQFMTEQFESQQRFEQVHKFVDDLKSQSVAQYIKNNQKNQQLTENFAEKLNSLYKANQDREYLDFFTRLKQSNFRAKNENKETDRAISQKMSSAQSQRLVSAQKLSQNEDSFNLDLTMKSKNFKNPYMASKADSLLYSAQSGFFPQQNQHKNEYSNSSKSVKQKMDNIEENQLEDENVKTNLHKNNSERKDYHQKVDKQQRIVSSKDKIQQFHENQYEANEQNINSSQVRISQLSQNNSLSANQKLASSRQQKQALDEKKSIKVLQNSQKLSSKAKAPQHKFTEEQESVKAETIINRMENFDADDEDEEEKQLHESAHFSKKRMNSQLKKRVETQAAKNKKDIKSQNYSIKNIKRFNKVDFTQLEQQNQRSVSQVISHHGSNSNIFNTEVENYQKKITKLRQEKEMKKRNLQKELARVNHEIKALNKKQEQLSPHNKNNFASRVKISDNNQAQKKAESLVKNLRSQKRNRNIAKVGQFVNLDRNINQYMEQLNKLRTENEQKLKQKKKLEILERMKQNQMRKLTEKKKISENQNFVLHLKGANGVSGEAQIKHEQDRQERNERLSKRSPTKQEQEIISSPQQSILTPELNQKKAHLNKVRNFDAKKQYRDAYEQILS